MNRLGVCALALLLALLAAVHVRAVAEPSMGELLAQADALRSSNPERSAELLQAAAALSAGASPSELDLLRYLQAYRLSYIGRFDEAIRHAEVLWHESADPAIRFRVGTYLANTRAITRDFESALRILDESLALIDEVPDRDMRHHGLAAAAILYNQIGQYELGLHYAQRVLADAPEARARCFMDQITLESRIELGLNEGLETLFHSVVRQCSAISEPIVASQARALWAARMAAAGQREAAMALLTTHRPEAISTGYARVIAQIDAQLAQYHLEAGQLQQAQLHAQQALDASQDSGYPMPLVIAHRVLHEVALRRGDLAAALRHYQRYAEADKANLDQTQARERAFLLTRHEALQKNQTIELLNRQNEVLQLEQQVARQNALNTQLLALLMLGLLAFLSFWAFKVKRLQMDFKRLSEADTLTGVHNRRHFVRSAEGALVEARSRGVETALIMLDLDHFKRINDEYGHASGDWVLIVVAEELRAVLTPGGFIGRLGGEEFAVLLPTCSRELASATAERMRKRIEAIDSSACAHVFPVSASFGVASTADAGYELSALLSQADHALYRAKREGRNLVREYVSEPGSGDARAVVAGLLDKTGARET